MFLYVESVAFGFALRVSSELTLNPSYFIIELDITGFNVPNWLVLNDVNLTWLKPVFGLFMS